ncbi:hypothetical protein THTE_3621 [Thermogutta terrifontis]|uniref:Uncharacterized protein n=1 Tax=Thermogutta terrifontis TaxID=1331910 RepID=A0A286RJX9_9BACT|nr:hypothetical protein THTE_3621 [Thermogutta terrifontis]
MAWLGWNRPSTPSHDSRATGTLNPRGTRVYWKDTFHAVR